MRGANEFLRKTLGDLTVAIAEKEGGLIVWLGPLATPRRVTRWNGIGTATGGPALTCVDYETTYRYAVTQFGVYV